MVRRPISWKRGAVNSSSEALLGSDPLDPKTSGRWSRDLALPLADLDRMDLELAGELGGGLQPAEGLEGHAGLEVGGMALAGSGHG